MTSGEFAYLVMAIGAMSIFALALFLVSTGGSNREPD